MTPNYPKPPHVFVMGEDREFRFGRYVEHGTSQHKDDKPAPQGTCSAHVNDLNFGCPNHTSGTAEVKSSNFVQKLTTSGSGDKLPPNGCGQGRSFVLWGQRSSLLWTPTLRPYSGPVRLPRESKGIGRCVRCMLATCRVKEGLSRSEQLVRYFYSAPLLDLAYCLA